MKTLSPNTLVSLTEAAELIRSGATLSVAGAEPLLDQLPPGNWIGGTSSYFSAQAGGVKSSSQLFVTPLPAEAGATFAYYDANDLPAIMRDAPDNGFSFAIIPAGGLALQRFAEESRFWPDILLKPVVGWIAGIDLELLGQSTPKIYDGRTGAKHADGMVVAHVTLPSDRLASIETVNIFERDPRNVIRFPSTGFTADACTINGNPGRLADCLKLHGNADGALPLIGDFAGASINVSVQSIDPASGTVTFYAPVFPDVEYYLASPIADYQARFIEELETRAGKHAVFSCNCILNHLYGKLEGKSIGTLHGPVTFGEIAYLLHNQTMVILTID